MSPYAVSIVHGYCATKGCIDKALPLIMDLLAVCTRAALVTLPSIFMILLPVITQHGFKLVLMKVTGADNKALSESCITIQNQLHLLRKPATLLNNHVQHNVGSLQIRCFSYTAMEWGLSVPKTTNLFLMGLNTFKIWLVSSCSCSPYLQRADTPPPIPRWCRYATPRLNNVNCSEKFLHICIS